MNKITKPLLHIDDDVRCDYYPEGVVSLDIKTDELSDELKVLVCDTVEAMVIRLISAQRKYQHGDSYQNKDWVENGSYANRVAAALYHGQTIDALNLIMFALHHDTNPGESLRKCQNSFHELARHINSAKAFIDSTCPDGTADEAFKPLFLDADLNAFVAVHGCVGEDDDQGNYQ